MPAAASARAVAAPMPDDAPVTTATRPASGPAAMAPCPIGSPPDPSTRGRMLDSAPAMFRSPRGRVRDLVVRLVGLLVVAAFVSLRVQVDVLLGSDGLLPAARWLAATSSATLLDAPTLFRLTGASDSMLHFAADAGIAAGLAATLGLAPRLAFVVAWALYLSFVTVGQDFFSFQWDNLLLETLPIVAFLAPGGLRPRRAPSPHPVALLLGLGLLVRLHVESGVAKLLGGDPTWRHLTAMELYYETAPLPTWVGWWAHQLPMAAQRATTFVVLAVEIGIAPLVLLPWRRIRVPAAAALVAVQLVIVATANYAFFNWLTLVLCLLALDDDDIARLVAPSAARGARPRTDVVAWVVGGAWLVVSVLPFARPQALAPVTRAIAPFRSVNAYALFVHMTLVRDEIVIEGSYDGETWREYELRWKPGDPSRAPAFVAPHQPRVDFQCWFVPLSGRIPPWLTTVLARVLSGDATVRTLFRVDPFDGRAPRMVRVALWRYHFTDRPTRRATGAWWTRELRGRGRAFEAGDLEHAR